jgi:peptidoglycan/LPS O-acetylase OafA/YrhL
VGELDVENAQESRSFASLEGLRLIASVAIVADHYFGYLCLPTQGLHLAVDLFFVISGIVIAMVYQGRIRDLPSYSRFVRKRLARLYPLHLATLLFYVMLGGLIATGRIAPENVEKYNPSEIIPNLLMIHAWSPFGVISYNYVSWSISAEFFVYLCFPLILYVVARGFAVGFAVCVALLLAAIAFSQDIMGTELTQLDWRFGALRAVPSFSFGVWLWVNRNRLLKIGIVRTYAGQAMSAAMAAVLVLIVWYPADYLLLGCVYVVAVGAFVCDLSGSRTFASWGPISRRGYLTYSIYMLHTVIATIVISFIFPGVFGKSESATLAAVVCSVALTYAVAYASCWHFERPLRGYIGGKRPSLASANPVTASSGQEEIQKC